LSHWVPSSVGNLSKFYRPLLPALCGRDCNLQRFQSVCQFFPYDQRQSNLFFAHMARIVTGQPLHSLAQTARAIPISKTSSFCFESLQDTFQIEAIFPGILRRVNGGRVLFDHQPAIVAVRTERLDHVRYPCYPQAQRGKDKAP